MKTVTANEIETAMNEVEEALEVKRVAQALLEHFADQKLRMEQLASRSQVLNGNKSFNAYYRETLAVAEILNNVLGLAPFRNSGGEHVTLEEFMRESKAALSLMEEKVSADFAVKVSSGVRLVAPVSDINLNHLALSEPEND
jgi:hypothetical protein